MTRWHVASPGPGRGGRRLRRVERRRGRPCAGASAAPCRRGPGRRPLDVSGLRGSGRVVLRRPDDAARLARPPARDRLLRPPSPCSEDPFAHEGAAFANRWRGSTRGPGCRWGGCSSSYSSPAPLGYFDSEIDQWMRPEAPLPPPTLSQVDGLALALARLEQVAARAPRWTVFPPSGHDVPHVTISWSAGADASGRPLRRSETLDATTGAPFRTRATGGGQTLYQPPLHPALPAVRGGPVAGGHLFHAHAGRPRLGRDHAQADLRRLLHIPPPARPALLARHPQPGGRHRAAVPSHHHLQRPGLLRVHLHVPGGGCDLRARQPRPVLRRGVPQPRHPSAGGAHRLPWRRWPPCTTRRSATGARRPGGWRRSTTPATGTRAWCSRARTSIP